MRMWEEIDVLETGRITLKDIVEWGKKYPYSSVELLEMRRKLGL